MTEDIVAGVEVEDRLLEDVSVDLGWELIERFASLVRESGSGDERRAADWIAERLGGLGIQHEVFEPHLYLSLPREAGVLVGELEIAGKPPSFAASTPDGGFTAPIVHVPAARLGDGVGDIFEASARGAIPDVTGRIVVTEGYSMPSTVQRFEAAGALGQVYINPGENVHWMICTPIWGTPTEEVLEAKPASPVISISRPDGEALLDRLAGEEGLEATLVTALDEGWFRCKVPVATIPGEREEFVLVHGHYDSWDVGIGDNAVGDATLLELARIFHTHREGLRRTLKVAWWPGHSTGRYAGSTWFADEFALDLRKGCVAAVNIDSPGCWRATEYEDVMWMAEADALCRGAIRDAAGKEATRARPVRAGDYSFNQIGLTSFFMLLSSIPEEERERLGFYPVGGCGGNIAWHTEDDTLEVADRENLERDLRVYVTALARVLNADVLPFDFRATATELEEALNEYREEAGELLDLDDVRVELGALRDELDWLYGALERGSSGGEPIAAGGGATAAGGARAAPRSGLDSEAVNLALVELSRHLVPIGYAEEERFEHDPALPRPRIPKLSGIPRLQRLAEEDPERLPFLQTGLRRKANQVANALFEAAEAVRRLRETTS